MSVTCQGAVWSCGPQEQTACFVLLAIADQADDFGVAVLAHETIAVKARCSVRTVIRQIEELEVQGWLRVGRKLWNGKANVYFIDLSKIGVNVSPDAKISPMHSTLRRVHGDILSLIFAPSKTGDTRKFSSDNPQGSKVPCRRTQVTKTPVSGDTGGTQSVLTVVEPLEPLSSVEPTPLPPTGGEISPVEDFPKPLYGDGCEVLDDGLPWSGFKLALKLDLGTQPNHPNFRQIEPGVPDYDYAFRDWWYRGIAFETADAYVIRTAAADPEKTRIGVAKYRRRIEKLLGEYFPIAPTIPIRFEFEPATTNPAGRSQR